MIEAQSHHGLLKLIDTVGIEMVGIREVVVVHRLPEIVDFHASRVADPTQLLAISSLVGQFTIPASQRSQNDGELRFSPWLIRDSRRLLDQEAD
jgi:hypothetical protein